MTVISKDGNCEWDEEKDLINRKKHHISFELASKVFYDPYFLEIEDETHSETEVPGIREHQRNCCHHRVLYRTVSRRKDQTPSDIGQSSRPKRKGGI